MEQSQEKSTKILDINTNAIIDNWEYLDDFLEKYIDHLIRNKTKQGNIFSELSNNLFTVKEQNKNIPTLNIIREKLWLYYYKEHFKKNSQGSQKTAHNKELDPQKLCS